MRLRVTLPDHEPKDGRTNAVTLVYYLQDDVFFARRATDQEGHRR